MRGCKTRRTGVVASAALALVLAACTPSAPVDRPAAAPPAAHRTAVAAPPAGAPLPTGASIAAMSDQYAHPRPGPVAAAGASAWVFPAPPAAFEVSSPLPPADPPAPPPAAVANRQPVASPAPAAGPVAADAPAASVDLAKGRALFSQYACGSCHILADGGGSGGIGPSLDSNPRLTLDYVAGAISEGRGTMPAFRDQMSAAEIATLAAYIVQVSRK